MVFKHINNRVGKSLYGLEQCWNCMGMLEDARCLWNSAFMRRCNVVNTGTMVLWVQLWLNPELEHCFCRKIRVFPMGGLVFH